MKKVFDRRDLFRTQTTKQLTNNKQTMNKLRTTLIHWLGGYTVEESVESDRNSWTLGALTNLINIKCYLDSLYGTTAEEWCDKAYKYINNQIKNIEESK